jgi:hypothetical protein
MVGETIFVGSTKKFKRLGVGSQIHKDFHSTPDLKTLPPPPLGNSIDQQH